MNVFIALKGTHFWILFGVHEWNKIRSYTEKKKQQQTNKYPLSVMTVFQYFKYINNKLKDRNIVVESRTEWYMYEYLKEWLKSSQNNFKIIL